MTTTEARRRVHVVVRGRVQGVAFRFATEAAAKREGVTGWVRNRPDGTVEAVFEGPAPGVDAMLGFARRGPPAARVEALEVGEEAPRGERGFEIRRGPAAP